MSPLFRVTIVVLVNLHVRPDVERGHQPRLVATLTTEATDVVRTTAGFHRDNAGRQALQEGKQTVPLDALAKNDRSRAIQSREAADRLAKIDAQYRDVHRNAPLHPPVPATVAAVRREGSSSH